MCYFLDKDEQPKIAKKDIVCWKEGDIIRDKFIPFYQSHFVYTKGEQQEEIDLVVKSTKYSSGTIHEGYHAYAKKRFYERERFIIPKGATYYSDGKYIVASTIIWKPFIWSVLNGLQSLLKRNKKGV